MGGRDILLKMEKVIGFSWLAHPTHSGLTGKAGTPKAGPGHVLPALVQEKAKPQECL